MKTHSPPVRVGEAGACPDWSGGHVTPVKTV